MARTPKGRARPISSLRRGQPTRDSYDRILVVCEGEKTEPNYFNEIRQEARISTLHIRILHSVGTQPLQVVSCAEAEFQKTKQFEKVFVVFDRDDHFLKKHFSRIPGDEAYTDVDEIVGILRAIRSSNR